MLLDAAILIAALGTAILLWLPKVHGSKTWRAMTTPLASIIGSGFLVLGPILQSEYGIYAPLVMAALCLGAYLFGSAIRYNITTRASETPETHPLFTRADTLASWSLSFAYVISVAYYLNLFGAFAVNLTPFDGKTEAKLVTSAVFLLILLVGWTRGFKSLEKMEYVSVAIKLAIIAGLLVGLAVYGYGRIASDALVFNPPALTGWAALTLAFGLIVTVQGFETSRYLGAEYDSQTRIHSMQWAQWLSSAIYMLYILLIAYVFEQSTQELTETTIIDMMAVVAPILPFLLVAAALAAQFSAAVADTSGSGGLMTELSGGRLTPRKSYALLVGLGLGLTWMFNVFEIISYASRAFALYYALQAGTAAISAWGQGHRYRSLAFVALAGFGVLIVVFGQEVEGA